MVAILLLRTGFTMEANFILRRPEPTPLSGAEVDFADW
jgi:hypothetical protein